MGKRGKSFNSNDANEPFDTRPGYSFDAEESFNNGTINLDDEDDDDEEDAAERDYWNQQADEWDDFDNDEHEY